jgi:hypothetical protein
MESLNAIDVEAITLPYTGIPCSCQDGVISVLALDADRDRHKALWLPFFFLILGS